jgi:hypothetical protein
MRAYANPNRTLDTRRLSERPEEPATRTAHGAFAGSGIESESTVGDRGDGWGS